MADLEQGPVGPQGGSDIKVLHTERDVTVYLLTESDLDRVSDLGLLAAGFSSLATFFGGLWLDLYKDRQLAENIPAATVEALGYVQPLLGILTVVFAVAAVTFWWKRGSLQGKIKNDSKSKRATGEVRPTLAGDD